MSKRYCLALDLKDSPQLIEEYKQHHQQVWPEITQSIRSAGVEDMEIYFVGKRLFMIMEVNDSFSFESPRPTSRAPGNSTNNSSVSSPSRNTPEE